MIRALLILSVLARVASADSDDDKFIAPPPVGSGVQLASTVTMQWRYQVTPAPALAPQIGALAVSGLDAVAGRGSAIAVLGDPAAPPAKWPYDIEHSETGVGMLKPQAAADQRTASLYAVTTFTLRAEHEGLRVVELRLRYADGIAVWLNGVEVARKALARGSTVALAARPHGPAWETFYVAVAPGLLRLGENTLAVEVHPSGRRVSPLLAADIIGRKELGIVRGPILADVRAATATIALVTDIGVGATIDWGVGDALDHHAESPPGKLHTFSLVDLPAKSRISYRVAAGASQSKTFAFHTMPAPGDTIRIGVYGDVRGGHTTHKRLVDAMLAEPLDLVAVTGDMVLHGSDEADWQQFFTMTGDMLAQLPYFPAIGNHDLGWDGADVARRAQEVFALPPGPPGRPDDAYWYSYDLADVHLVFLDSNAYERPEQEQWLEADLAAARANKVRSIIAFTHDGPYARGLHRGDKVAAERYVPILAKHRVDLVLSGHDHLYQRGEHAGVRYIVSGGGGAGLYQQSCGVGGKPKCPDDGMQKIFIEHHYLTLTITKDTLEMCPRRADGTLLEKCVRYKLR